MINGNATFTDRLNYIIELRNETNAEIARRIGTSPTSIYKYREEGAMPRVDIFFKLAEYLDVSEHWLFGKDAPMDRQFDSVRDDTQYVTIKTMCAKVETAATRLEASDLFKFCDTINQSVRDFCKENNLLP